MDLHNGIILLSNRDNTYSVILAETGEELTRLYGESSPAKIWPDGFKIVTTSSDRTVRIWESLRHPMHFPLEENIVTDVQHNFDFSSDGKQLVTIPPTSNGVFVFDAINGNPIQKLDIFQPPEYISCSAEGGKILVGAQWRKLITYLWDSGDDGDFYTKVDSVKDAFPVQFNSDGFAFLTSIIQRNFEIRNTDSLGSSLIINTGRDTVDNGVFSFFCSVLDGASEFTPDNKEILTIPHIDGSAIFYDAFSGSESGRISINGEFISGFIFNPSHSSVLTLSLPLEILDVEIDSSDLSYAIFEKIHDYLSEPTYRVWNISSREELYELTCFNTPFFSPDGKKMATCNIGDNELIIGDFNMDLEIATLTGHSAAITSFIFSPDGSRLLSASEDKTIKIWDTASGEEITSLSLYSSPINEIVIDPTATKLVCLTVQDTVHKMEWDNRAQGKAHIIQISPWKLSNPETYRNWKKQNIFLHEVNRFKDNPLLFRAVKGDLGSVRRLISQGVDVNARDASDGKTALIAACREGYLEVAKELIEAGADVTLTDNQGRNAIYVSARQRYVPIVKLLIDNGCDINQRTITDETALLSAAWAADTYEMIKLLVESGAEINIRRKSDDTVLAAAVSAENEKIVQFLIDSGADVNIRGARGTFPLIDAVYRRDLDMVKLLIAAGADVNMSDDSGNPPFQYAQDVEIVNALIKAGGVMTREQQGHAVRIAEKWNNLDLVAAMKRVPIVD